MDGNSRGSSPYPLCVNGGHLKRKSPEVSLQSVESLSKPCRPHPGVHTHQTLTLSSLKTFVLCSCQGHLSASQLWEVGKDRDGPRISGSLGLIQHSDWVRLSPYVSLTPPVFLAMRCSPEAVPQTTAQFLLGSRSVPHLAPGYTVHLCSCYCGRVGEEPHN